MLALSVGWPVESLQRTATGPPCKVAGRVIQAGHDSPVPALEGKPMSHAVPVDHGEAQRKITVSPKRGMSLLMVAALPALLLAIQPPRPRPGESLAGDPVPFLPHGKHVGRNDPCCCGSGKKFKKCCWGKIEHRHINAVAKAKAAESPSAQLKVAQ